MGYRYNKRKKPQSHSMQDIYCLRLRLAGARIRSMWQESHLILNPFPEILNSEHAATLVATATLDCGDDGVRVPEREYTAN